MSCKNMIRKCRNATAPVNIMNNDRNICDNFCKYIFNYPFTNLLYSHNDDYLLFKTDPEKNSSVDYNTKKYNVKEFRIYKPSLHKFNGKSTDAELIVYHTNITGNGNLLVCVPIIKSTNINESSTALSSIINNPIVMGNTNKKNLNLSTFSLNKLIKAKKPFYSYRGTLLYDRCNGRYEYVVIDKSAAANIDTSTFNKLDSLIKNNCYKVVERSVYYNESGGSKSQDESTDNIWIDCNPTGSDGEILVSKEKSNNLTMFSHLFDNNINLSDKAIKFFYAFFGVILIALIMYILHKLFNLLETGNIHYNTESSSNKDTS